MIGKWLLDLITGTALISSVFLVAVSKVLMPLSHNTTFGLPSAIIYSAAFNHSSIVALNPRFSNTGKPVLPASFSK